MLRDHPHLLGWALAPVVVVMGLMGIAAVSIWIGAGTWMDATWQPPPPESLEELVRAVTLNVLRAALIAVAWVGLALASGVIGAPFYDRLAAATEAIVDGATPAGAGRALSDIAVSMAHSSIAVVLWVAGACVLSALAGIPAIGPVLEVLGTAVFTSLFLAREMMDPAMSHQRLSFAEKVRFVWAHSWVTGGFGLATLCALAVPGVNLVALPAAIVGGTLLFLDFGPASANVEARLGDARR